jgi:hypothetical protein
MSLYEYSLFNIFNQLNTDKISYDQLIDLPEDILNDLDVYLIREDESYENYIETGFYTSIKSKHFIFAEFFINQIDNIDIINNGLKYATDIESVEFLVKHGADDWDKGLFGSVYNNNMDMIKYFIKLGANDFNGAMLQAIIKNDMKLINYFIDLGANAFDDGLSTATQMNNIKLINFFIEKGATDFDEGLYIAACFGLDNLISFYINLGATDYMTALGCAIDNNNFTDLLIPPFRKNEIKPCIVGDSFLYFLENTDFESKSGNNINHLIPFLIKGYATEQSLRLIMKLYTYNSDSDSYNIAFGKMPSLNEKIIQNHKMILKVNNNKNTTFDNIKKYQVGFYPNFIDPIYFPNIIELNIYKSDQLSKEDKTFLTDNTTLEQLWKELMIIKAVVNFYD